MARDLIPPPSPAGRPQPEGTPRLVELPPDPPPAVEAAPGPTAPLPPTRFRNRFGFLIGALAGVVVVSSLVLVVILATGNGVVDEGLAPNWSKWQPTDTSIDGGAAQIAEKVGAEYRHPDGKQLTLVRGGLMPLRVVLRPATGDISEFDGTTVLYSLDGLGPNQSIKGGKVSEARHKVLQREALELALYTFRYLPDAEMVVTLLPPLPPKEPAAATPSPTPAGGNGAVVPSPTPDPETQRNAIFYRPGDLKPQLQVPLGMTVSAKAPTADTLLAAEAQVIDTLTLSNLFVASIPRPPGDALVLDRPSNP